MVVPHRSGAQPRAPISVPAWCSTSHCTSFLLYRLFRVLNFRMNLHRHLFLVPLYRLFRVLNFRMNLHRHLFLVPLYLLFRDLNFRVKLHRHLFLVPLYRLFRDLNFRMKLHRHLFLVPLYRLFRDLNFRMKLHRHLFSSSYILLEFPLCTVTNVFIQIIPSCFSTRPVHFCVDTIELNNFENHVHIAAHTPPW